MYTTHGRTVSSTTSMGQLVCVLPSRDSPCSALWSAIGRGSLCGAHGALGIGVGHGFFGEIQPGAYRREHGPGSGLFIATP